MPPEEHPDREGAGRSGGADVRPGATDARDPPVTLRYRIVEYPDRADRCTIFPAGIDDVALMSTWLTADCGDFVDLANWR